MAKAIKTPKQPKEPVRVRYKTLSDGSQSVYLDIYRDGKRQYEFLKLYLIPETNAAAKAQNKATLAAVNTIKSQRIIELTNGVAGLKNTSLRSKMLLLDWMQAYKESQEKKGVRGSGKLISNTMNVLRAFNAKAAMRDLLLPCLYRLPAQHLCKPERKETVAVHLCFLFRVLPGSVEYGSPRGNHCRESGKQA